MIIFQNSVRKTTVKYMLKFHLYFYKINKLKYNKQFLISLPFIFIFFSISEEKKYRVALDQDVNRIILQNHDFLVNQVQSARNFLLVHEIFSYYQDIFIKKINLLQCNLKYFTDGKKFLADLTWLKFQWQLKTTLESFSISFINCCTLNFSLLK